jgi:murein DD-endopeptidase MepM/ murein hydrolase activator NlpD
MQILITRASGGRTRAISLQPGGLVLLAGVLLLTMIVLSGTIYHFVFLKAAREGWPIVSHILQWVVRDELAQRDRHVRENLDAMAEKLGQIQAKLHKLDALSERISGMAGIKLDALTAGALAPAAQASSPGPAPNKKSGSQGGPFVAIQDHAGSQASARGGILSMEQLAAAVTALDQHIDERGDVFLYIESRLLESRLLSLTLPSTFPVAGPVGSGFGFRSDPFTGRPALHTGLDFPADTGAPVVAAASGIVATIEVHTHYGNMVEIEHGGGLVTRYAHLSSHAVRPGQVVRQGDLIARVGSTGRSTGPHLHFEVLLDGVHQNPAKFLGRSLGLSPAKANSGVSHSTLSPSKARSAH